MWNDKWPIWIFTSSSKFFYDAINSIVPLHIFGQDYTPFATMKDKAEFRIVGPESQELSKGYWRLNYDINVILKTAKDNDYGRKETLAGKIVSAFTDIPLFRFGDDGLRFGCLQLNGRVEKLDLGEFDDSLVCSISAAYQIHLKV